MNYFMFFPYMIHILTKLILIFLSFSFPFLYFLVYFPTGLMLGRTPPLALVTPWKSFPSSSSFLTTSSTCHGVDPGLLVATCRISYQLQHLHFNPKIKIISVRERERERERERDVWMLRKCSTRKEFEF